MTKIIVSSGDPAGIGPDICIKAFGKNRELSYKPVVFGNIELFKQRADLLGCEVNIREYSGQNSEELSGEFLWMIDRQIDTSIEPGKPSPDSARYIMGIFEESVKRVISKEFNAIVTCPINKELINEAGISFTGHTEELAKISNTERVVMMIANEKIKIALATTHVPLTEVSSHISKSLLYEVISILNNSLKEYLGKDNPVIKVLGLNPHAGDGGFIGNEEKNIITPALEDLRSKGMNVLGPLSADTAFLETGTEDKADVFLAMFHDQGLPVIKTMGFGETVNVTLGLPFVRTSVDHGTAYDITGTGRADDSSLLAAAKMACSMCER